MSVTEHETATTGLPTEPQGTALPDAGSIDVTTLRGRRAVHRWERTSFGDVLEHDLREVYDLTLGHWPQSVAL